MKTSISMMIVLLFSVLTQAYAHERKELQCQMINDLMHAPSKKIRFFTKNSEDAAEVYYVNEARYVFEWQGEDAKEKPVTYAITPTITNLPGNIIWFGHEVHNLSTGKLELDFPSVEQHVLSPSNNYEFKIPEMKFGVEIPPFIVNRTFSIRCQVRTDAKDDSDALTQSSRANAQELGESTADIYSAAGEGNAAKN